MKLSNLGKTGEFVPPCHKDCEGFISIEHEGEILAGECPVLNAPGCLVPENVDRWLRQDMARDGWPKRYVTHASWGLCKAEPEIRGWLRERTPERGLLLSGPAGGGKTMASFLVAYELWNVQPATYVLWPEFVQKLSSDRDLFDRVIRVPLLVLDDFGVGGWPDWVNGKIDALFEIRNARMSPSIVTTNLTTKTLVEEPGYSRFVDRWRESMTSVVIPGPSMRVSSDL